MDDGFEDALFLLPEILVRGVPVRLLNVVPSAITGSEQIQRAELSYWLAAVSFHLKDQARAIEFLQQIETQAHRLPYPLLARALSLAARFQAWMLSKVYSKSKSHVAKTTASPPINCLRCTNNLGFFMNTRCVSHNKLCPPIALSWLFRLSLLSFLNAQRPCVDGLNGSTNKPVLDAPFAKSQ